MKEETTPLKLFGLLHCKQGERSAINFQPRDFQEQVSIYVRNAIHLAHTLRQQSVSFTLVTNEKAIVDSYVASDHGVLQTIEIPFITAVPSGVNFYSAHFKLDVFRYLAGLSDEYVGLCDLDMVCINPCPLSLQNAVAAGTPLCYDVSDQVIPVYGRDVIIRDLEWLHGLESEGKWSGGEFIAGPPDFFALLVAESEALYHAYLDNIHRVHHTGDETVTSAAIEVLRKKGVSIGDAGTSGIVGTYWSGDTLHPQKPLASFEQCFLLHLPADKRFLAELARRGAIDPSAFMPVYAKHCRRLQFVRSQIEKAEPATGAAPALPLP